MLNVLLWYDSTDKEILIDLDAKVEPLVEGLNDSIEKHDSEFCHARKDWIKVREWNNLDSIFLPYYIRPLMIFFNWSKIKKPCFLKY